MTWRRNSRIIEYRAPASKQKMPEPEVQNLESSAVGSKFALAEERELQEGNGFSRHANLWPVLVWEVRATPFLTGRSARVGMVSGTCRRTSRSSRLQRRNKLVRACSLVWNLVSLPQNPHDFPYHVSSCFCRHQREGLVMPQLMQQE